MMDHEARSEGVPDECGRVRSCVVNTVDGCPQIQHRSTRWRATGSLWSQSRGDRPAALGSHLFTNRMQQRVVAVAAV